LSEVGLLAAGAGHVDRPGLGVDFHLLRRRHLELAEERAVGPVDRHPAVALVGHVDVAGGVHRHARCVAEQLLAAAGLAGRAGEERDLLVAQCELVHRVVAFGPRAAAADHPGGVEGLPVGRGRQAAGVAQLADQRAQRAARGACSRRR